MSSAADGTVFGVAPLQRTLPVAAGVLVLVFVAVRPEASAGLGLVGRLGFWLVHVGIGLAGLVAASAAIRRRPLLRLPLALSIPITGVVGAAVAAPAYWLADQWLPVPAGAVPDDWLDHFAALGAWQGILAELLEVAPLFVTSWFAINLPLILAQPRLEGPPAAGPGGDSPDAARRTPPTPAADTDAAADFFDRLPTALGRDLISLSSDLHYLHVHTTRGHTMVLGNLRDAVTALGERGMLVHRSHWVAHAHVARVLVAGSKASCVMSNGLKVPVSRRKRAAVRSLYGSGAVSLRDAPEGRSRAG